MARFIRTLVFMACGWFAATSAIASPKLLYKFTHESYQCSYEACNFDFRDALDVMDIGLTPAALSNGQASLQIYSSYLAQVTDVSFFRPYGGPLTFFPQGVNLDGFKVGDLYPPEQFYLRSTMDLQVGQFLTGDYVVGDLHVDVVMTTDRSSMSFNGLDEELVYVPSSPNQWTGYVASDVFSGRIYFTGEWRFAGVVSEPGTLALLIAALAVSSLASMRRSKGRSSRTVG